MPIFTPLEWLLLAITAGAVGRSKSGMPAFGPVPAGPLRNRPAGEGVHRRRPGLLLVGDLIAVRMYQAHADWKILRRLIPSIDDCAAGRLVPPMRYGETPKWAERAAEAARAAASESKHP